MALVTTVSGTSSNSYADVTYADAYFADHFSAAKRSAWEGLTTGQKERVLLSAMPVIERVNVLTDYQRHYWYPSFDGATGHVVRAVYNQALIFPRNVDLDLVDPNTYVVPERVKDAQCEQAVYLVNFDEAIIAAQLQGLRNQSVSAGPVSASEAYQHMGIMLAPMARELMAEFMISTDMPFWL